MAELKPCPFCGGFAHIDKTGSMTCFRDAAVYCEGCDSWFVMDAFNATEDDLIAAWNRRWTESTVIQNGKSNTCIHNVGTLYL